jgi:nitrite reductase/ring-hydroxylating ferredoxin subunit
MNPQGEAVARKWLIGDSQMVCEKGRIVVNAAGLTIGVFRLNGSLFAYENVCVHQGGPVCQGRLMPKVQEALDERKVSLGMKFEANDLHIVCPWHGFEYSVRTGRHPGDARLRLRSFPVSEENGQIHVTA